MWELALALLMVIGAMAIVGTLGSLFDDLTRKLFLRRKK